MRILFYLPVVTPLWFDEVIAPILRTLHGHAELHLLVPTLWRNTGIGRGQLAACADLVDVHWHLVDGPGHESLRTAPDDVEGLRAFVQSIAPDHVLCRAAETGTAAGFPGRVHYLMEAGAPPLATDHWVLALHAGIFDYGVMPTLNAEQANALDALFASRWQAAQDRHAGEAPFDLDREAALALMGLPHDRRILAVPLEYEHEENFFPVQHRFARNRDLVAHLLDRAPADFVLAFTDHPLNGLHGGDSELRALLAHAGDRARLVALEQAGGASTNLLVKHADGLILQNSKSYAAGAFFGKPMLRMSHRPSAAWLNMYANLEEFVSALRAGTAAAPDPQAARTWFACRVADESFAAKAISAHELIDRLESPISSGRWAGGIARYDQHQPRS